MAPQTARSRCISEVSENRLSMCFTDTADRISAGQWAWQSYGSAVRMIHPHAEPFDQGKNEVMSRLPLAPGAHGQISHSMRDGNHIARCRYRDYDGVPRQIERAGKTKTAAKRNLLAALRMGRDQNAPLRPESRFLEASKLWLAQVAAKVADEQLVGTTYDQYRQRLNTMILPDLGQLRLAECTVGRMDAFFTGLARRGLKPATRSGVRNVVKQVLGVAVLHEAISANPIDALPRRASSRAAKPRALTPEERRRWLEFLATDETAVRRDLHDLSVFMLGTGVRIGEALALRWVDVDLEGVPVVDAGRMVPVVAITGNIVAVIGKGLVRHAGKTEKALRIIPLPQFVVDMLTARPRGDAEEPVFPALARGTGALTWRSPSNVMAYIAQAREAAGVTWKLTSHTYRKTAATIWHDGALSDRQCADLTGHAKISTLKDIYVARGELHHEGAAVMDAAWLNT
jgi:integrase